MCYTILVTLQYQLGVIFTKGRPSNHWGIVVPQGLEPTLVLIWNAAFSLYE